MYNNTQNQKLRLERAIAEGKALLAQIRQEQQTPASSKPKPQPPPKNQK